MFIAWTLLLTAIWADFYFKRFPDPPQKPQSDDGRAAADINPTVEAEVEKEDSDVPAVPPKPLVNPRLLSWFFFITQFVVTILAMAVSAIDYSNDCAESAIPGLSAEDVVYAWSVPCLARHMDIPFISPDVVPICIAMPSWAMPYSHNMRSWVRSQPHREVSCIVLFITLLLALCFKIGAARHGASSESRAVKYTLYAICCPVVAWTWLSGLAITIFTLPNFDPLVVKDLDDLIKLLAVSVISFDAVVTEAEEAIKPTPLTVEFTPLKEDGEYGELDNKRKVSFQIVEFEAEDWRLYELQQTLAKMTSIPPECQRLLHLPVLRDGPRWECSWCHPCGGSPADAEDPKNLTKIGRHPGNSTQHDPNKTLHELGLVDVEATESDHVLLMRQAPLEVTPAAQINRSEGHRKSDPQLEGSLESVAAKIGVSNPQLEGSLESVAAKIGESNPQLEGSLESVAAKIGECFASDAMAKIGERFASDAMLGFDAGVVDASVGDMKDAAVVPAELWQLGEGRRASTVAAQLVDSKHSSWCEAPPDPVRSQWFAF